MSKLYVNALQNGSVREIVIYRGEEVIKVPLDFKLICKLLGQLVGMLGEPPVSRDTDDMDAAWDRDAVAQRDALAEEEEWRLWEKTRMKASNSKE